MEQLFYLHQVPILQNLTLTSLYLYSDQFVWYQWPCGKKNILMSLGQFLQMK
jgi:hypothetical protein